MFIKGISSGPNYPKIFRLRPIYDIIIQAIACSDEVAFDDTKAKISWYSKKVGMGLEGEGSEGNRDNEENKVSKVSLNSISNKKLKPPSTTGWASVFVTKDAIAYIIDRDHAGKNFQEILKFRPRYLAPPIALSDALPSYRNYKNHENENKSNENNNIEISGNFFERIAGSATSSNSPKEKFANFINCLSADCLTHARRRFVEAKEEDEVFCEKIISLIGKIYFNDDTIKKLKLSPIERMKFHQKESRPVLNKIMNLIQSALEEELYQPNFEISKALNYWSEEFNKLTLFTRIPGVSLDTNFVERGVKAIIRIRKQAPIFKTINGAARTGRILTLIETARMQGLNPERYIAWAIKGIENKTNPHKLTPWEFLIHIQHSATS